MQISVIGSGYVGLVAGACFAELGHSVRCLDTDERRVEAINAGAAPFHEPGLDERIAAGLAQGRLEASTDVAEAVANSDVTFLAVGTPDADGMIDLGQIRAAADSVGRALADGTEYHVVVAKSTVVPGTTASVIGPAIYRAAGRPPEEIGLCMNPEFLRQGFAVEDFLHPDRIVVGAGDDRAADLVMSLYDGLDGPRIRTTLSNAEMIKYASNALLSTMISFSNEIANICESTPGTDAARVLEAVHLDRRITVATEHGAVTPGLVTYLMSGGGFGGSCLPKDLRALAAYAGANGVDAPLLRATASVNEHRPRRVVGMLADELGDLAGKRVAVAGIAFKAETDDVRDSPAAAIIRELSRQGADVVAWDPGIRADTPGVPPVPLVQEPADLFRGVDGLVLATAWPQIRGWNWTHLVETMRQAVIVDSRGILAGIAIPDTVRVRSIGVPRA